jgi:hypothetical protein
MDAHKRGDVGRVALIRSSTVRAYNRNYKENHEKLRSLMMLEREEEDEGAHNRTSSHGAAESANSPLEELPDSFWVEAVADMGTAASAGQLKLYGRVLVEVEVSPMVKIGIRLKGTVAYSFENSCWGFEIEAELLVFFGIKIGDVEAGVTVSVKGVLTLDENPFELPVDEGEGSAFDVLMWQDPEFKAEMEERVGKCGPAVGKLHKPAFRNPFELWSPFLKTVAENIKSDPVVQAIVSLESEKLSGTPAVKGYDEFTQTSETQPALYPLSTLPLLSAAEKSSQKAHAVVKSASSDMSPAGDLGDWGVAQSFRALAKARAPMVHKVAKFAAHALKQLCDDGKTPADEATNEEFYKSSMGRFLARHVAAWSNPKGPDHEACASQTKEADCFKTDCIWVKDAPKIPGTEADGRCYLKNDALINTDDVGAPKQTETPQSGVSSKRMLLLQILTRSPAVSPTSPSKPPLAATTATPAAAVDADAGSVSDESGVSDGTGTEEKDARRKDDRRAPDARKASIFDDRVVNFAKVMRHSRHRDNPYFWRNVAVSVSNLFVRFMSDVQAIFNVYFAGSPNWTGACRSLPAKHVLLLETKDDTSARRKLGYHFFTDKRASAQGEEVPDDKVPWFQRRWLSGHALAPGESSKEAAHWATDCHDACGIPKALEYVPTTIYPTPLCLAIETGDPDDRAKGRVTPAKGQRKKKEYVPSFRPPQLTAASDLYGPPALSDDAAKLGLGFPVSFARACKIMRDGAEEDYFECEKLHLHSTFVATFPQLVEFFLDDYREHARDLESLDHALCEHAGKAPANCMMHIEVAKALAAKMLNRLRVFILRFLNSRMHGEHVSKLREETSQEATVEGLVPSLDQLMKEGLRAMNSTAPKGAWDMMEHFRKCRGDPGCEVEGEDTKEWAAGDVLHVPLNATADAAQQLLATASPEAEASKAVRFKSFRAPSVHDNAMRKLRDQKGRKSHHRFRGHQHNLHRRKTMRQLLTSGGLEAEEVTFDMAGGEECVCPSSWSESCTVEGVAKSDPKKGCASQKCHRVTIFPLKWECRPDGETAPHEECIYDADCSSGVCDGGMLGFERICMSPPLKAGAPCLRHKECYSELGCKGLELPPKMPEVPGHCLNPKLSVETGEACEDDDECESGNCATDKCAASWWAPEVEPAVGMPGVETSLIEYMREDFASMFGVEFEGGNILLVGDAYADISNKGKMIAADVELYKQAYMASSREQEAGETPLVVSYSFVFSVGLKGPEIGDMPVIELYWAKQWAGDTSQEVGGQDVSQCILSLAVVGTIGLELGLDLCWMDSTGNSESNIEDEKAYADVEHLLAQGNGTNGEDQSGEAGKKLEEWSKENLESMDSSTVQLSLVVLKNAKEDAVMMAGLVEEGLEKAAETLKESSDQNSSDQNIVKENNEQMSMYVEEEQELPEGTEAAEREEAEPKNEILEKVKATLLALKSDPTILLSVPLLKVYSHNMAWVAIQMLSKDTEFLDGLHMRMRRHGMTLSTIGSALAELKAKVMEAVGAGLQVGKGAAGEAEEAQESSSSFLEVTALSATKAAPSVDLQFEGTLDIAMHIRSCTEAERKFKERQCAKLKKGDKTAKVDESEFVYLSPCEASAASGDPGCKHAPACLRAKPIGEAERGLTVQAVLAYEPEFPAMGPVTITPLLGMDYVVDLVPVVNFVAQKDREREFEQRRHKCLKCVEKSLAFCDAQWHDARYDKSKSDECQTIDAEQRMSCAPNGGETGGVTDSAWIVSASGCTDMAFPDIVAEELTEGEQRLQDEREVLRKMAVKMNRGAVE